MLERLVYPVVYFRKIPPAMGLSLGGLLGVILAVFVVGQRSERQTEQLFEEYGHALVTLTATRALGSVVNQDLVGLHALLQEVVAEPRVVFAAVYNESQKPLVQSGDPFGVGEQREFSSAVALQDSYAGRVVVVLSRQFSGDGAVQWALVGVITLLALMVVLSLYDAYGDAWVLRTRVLSKASVGAKVSEGQELAEDTDSAVQEVVGVESDMVEAHATCGLYIKAIDAQKLHQQLSADLYGSVLRTFESLIERVFALYSGKVSAVGDGAYTVRIGAETGPQAQFHALCAGLLLEESLKHHKLSFSLAMLAAPCEDATEVSKVGVCVIGCDESMLSERFELRKLSERLQLVTGVKPPYDDLLAEQVARISV